MLDELKKKSKILKNVAFLSMWSSTFELFADTTEDDKIIYVHSLQDSNIYISTLMYSFYMLPTQQQCTVHISCI